MLRVLLATLSLSFGAVPVGYANPDLEDLRKKLREQQTRPVVAPGESRLEGKLFGALAIDENRGDQYGWAVDYRTSAEADERALRECGIGCRVVRRFADQCAAYVVDASEGSTISAWATAEREIMARATATTECVRRGGKDCRARVWGCTTR